MKWLVAGLLLAGVVAAVCVAVLLVSFRRPGAVHAAVEAQEVRILVATRSLPAMAVVDAESVVEKIVTRREAPPGYLSDFAQAAGQVLAVPMVEGRPFTRTCFAREGSGKHLAATVPEGMRAVSVSLRTHLGLRGILYPGSLVDVLVALRAKQKGDSVATTLLQGIQVLGVAPRTVVTPDDDAEGGKDKNAPLRNTERMITLLVTPKQAEILHLAIEHGTVSLALRNPLDGIRVETVGVLLSELRLGDEGKEISPSADGRLVDVPPVAVVEPTPVVVVEPTPAAVEETSVAVEPVEEKKRRAWEVVILRGGKRETRSVPLPSGAGPR